MMKKIVCLALMTLFMSCNNSDDELDCSAVLCVQPSIFINLIDSETNENLVLQNNISNEDILILNKTETEQEFNIIESNGLLSIPKSLLTGSLDININSVHVAFVNYDTSIPETDTCCDSGNLINVSVTDKTFELDNNTVTIFL
ncbi:hypothetical protein [Algibacter lectus]|uniref:Uncharacterized protein n=1 Tax=Algibacter lectus TaxID=221126 RepID=A0A090VIF3_9FLAO|nr:hypothetical protein [Algibacter lectus]MDO7138936.1 hypothetical protein [Algibacter lectus]MWW25853.1 hypothetical protein [Algibacter lectus]TDY61136.1 hypothetical protein DFQ06_3154 [Algibacter lectus]SFD69705.1 hypothetical protein SAMN04489722_11612 [Algibacter lectus]GAL63139.1 hypothetical protein JCM19300_1161 [Algibacter lectus]